MSYTEPAKHQQLSQQNGGSKAPPPPALPSIRPTFEQKVKITLKTRNWGDQPWGASQQPESYALPNNSRSGVSSYPSSGTSHSSGLPTSNYTPSSTIPMHSNYHLPSSQLARSSTPDSIKEEFSAPQTNDDDAYSGFQPTNIPNAPALPTWNNKRSTRSRPLRTRNWGNRTENGWSGFQPKNVLEETFLHNRVKQAPVAPPAPSFTRGWVRGPSKMRPLRTRNWGNRTENGWSGFQPKNVLEETFLHNRVKQAPVAPSAPSFTRQRSWVRGPYKMRPLRTRNWGVRNEEGWSHFNRGIYAHESALPFNFNKNRSLDSGVQNTIPQQQSFIPQQSYAAPQQTFAPIQSYAPVTRTISSVGPMAAATPVAAQAPLTGRKARKAERRQLKQAAIQHKLVNHFNAPIGNPEVNHYRRGAKAVVPVAPIAGINTGVAPIASASVRPRRQGRSRRGRSRTATAVLPPVATGFVAPAAAASVFTAPQPSFTQPMMQSGAYPSSYTIVQPQSIPQHPALYSSAAQQIKPLSSTMLNSQGMPISNAPLYSAHEPVAAHILQKQAQAPVTFVRPSGSATF